MGWHLHCKYLPPKIWHFWDNMGWHLHCKYPPPKIWHFWDNMGWHLHCKYPPAKIWHFWDNMGWHLHCKYPPPKIWHFCGFCEVLCVTAYHMKLSHGDSNTYNIPRCLRGYSLVSRPHPLTGKSLVIIHWALWWVCQVSSLNSEQE